MWSVRTDLLLHCLTPTKGSYRLNVQSGLLKLKTTGETELRFHGGGRQLCVYSASQSARIAVVIGWIEN